MAKDDSIIWRYLKAVGSHWVELMSGGIITVALSVIERVSGYSFPLYVYLIVLFFFILLACFLAWRDAYNSQKVLLKEQQDNTPLFKGDIEIILAGELGRRSGGLSDTFDGFEFGITTYFANNRSVPTSIVKIYLDISINGTLHKAELPTKNRLMFTDLRGHEPLRERLNSIMHQGELFKGYLIFQLQNILIKDDDTVKLQRMVIKDTFGIEHEIRPSNDGVVKLLDRRFIQKFSKSPRLTDQIEPILFEPLTVSSDLKSLARNVLSHDSD